MIKKNMLVLIICIVLFSCAILPSIAATKAGRFSEAKKASYKAIAEAYYNPETYNKFKLEIIEILGRLSDRTGHSYSEESFENSQIFQTLKSMLVAVTENLNKKKNADKVESIQNANNKVEEALSYGDSSIAYMLKDALVDEDDFTIQLYAGSSLLNLKDNNAAPIFIPLLRNGNDKNRTVVLGILGNSKSEAAVPDLIAIINDEKTPQRIKDDAHFVLWRIFTPDSYNFYTNQLNSSDKKLQANAIAFMIANNLPEGTASMEKILIDKELQGYLGGYIVSIVEKRQKGVMPLINTLMQHESGPVRSSTVTAIEQLKDKDLAIELLQSALNDSNPDVKLNAYKVLANIKNDKVPLILKTVQFEQPQLFKKALEYLIKANNPQNLPVFEAYLNAADNHIKLNAAQYLLSKNKENKEAVSTLKVLLSNEDVTLKYPAAIYLLEYDYTEGRDVVRTLLDSKNNSLKAKATLLLAMKDDQTVVPILEKYIEDIDDYKQNYGAALLLYNLGKYEYRETLLKYLSQGDIGTINTDFVNKKLFKELLSNSNPWVRLNVANSLYESGDKETLNVIRELVNNPDVKVRAKAAKIIGSYGDPDDIEILRKMVDDKSVRVRVNASEAILRIINRQENKLGVN